MSARLDRITKQLPEFIGTTKAQDYVPAQEFTKTTLQKISDHGLPTMFITMAAFSPIATLTGFVGSSVGNLLLHPRCFKNRAATPETPSLYEKVSNKFSQLGSDLKIAVISVVLFLHWAGPNHWSMVGLPKWMDQVVIGAVYAQHLVHSVYRNQARDVAPSVPEPTAPDTTTTTSDNTPGTKED